MPNTEKTEVCGMALIFCFIRGGESQKTETFESSGVCMGHQCRITAMFLCEWIMMMGRYYQSQKRDEYRIVIMNEEWLIIFNNLMPSIFISDLFNERLNSSWLFLGKNVSASVQSVHLKCRQMVWIALISLSKHKFKCPRYSIRSTQKHYL